MVESFQEKTVCEETILKKNFGKRKLLPTQHAFEPHIKWLTYSATSSYSTVKERIVWRSVSKQMAYSRTVINQNAHVAAGRASSIASNSNSE